MAVADMICLFRVAIVLIGIPTALSMEFEGTPSNLTSFVGETVKLTCVIDDKDEDNPVYWQIYDGASARLGTISRDRNTASYAHLYPDLSPRLQIVGDESRGEYNLLISDLNLRDQGRYVCFFRNEGGYGEYAPITHLRVFPRQLTAALPGTSVGTAVNPSCQATVALPSQAVTVGTSVTLVCSADGLLDITSLTWYVGSDPAFANQGSCQLSKSLQQRICTFRRTLTLQDIGKTFRCIGRLDPLEQQQGSRRSNAPSCSLTPMSSSETVSVSPKQNHVTAGEMATFYCTTTADPNQVEFTWYLNGEPLESTTQLLVVSSDDLQDNIITCVVSGHFEYLGHGNAFLIVDRSRGGENPPATTVLSTPPTSNPMTTSKIDSISEHVNYVQRDEEPVTFVQFSIDDSKSPTNTVDRQISLFPMVMVISLASGAIFLAVLLAVATACVITRKKRGDASFDDKTVQLETVRPDSGQAHVDKKVTRTRSSRVAPNVKWAPDSASRNDYKAPSAYAVLDPDNVDNDSLSSLELQDIINSSDGSPHGQPPTRLETRPREVQQKHKDMFSTDGNPNISRGRSASTPGGPVVVYAGERKQESFAVAYAVTNIIGDRKWSGVGENNDNVTPPVFYDNNMITSAGAKGISRKRAMSSPMTSQITDEGKTTSKCGKNPIMPNENTSSMYNASRAQFHVDETSAYAEIGLPELVASIDKETKGYESNGGAISTVPEPPFPRSYLRSSNAYAVTKVVSPPRVKPRPSSHVD